MFSLLLLSEVTFRMSLAKIMKMAELHEFDTEAGLIPRNFQELK